MLTGEQWNQLLQGFLSEGRDLLKDAEDSLLQLETTPDDSEAVNSLFRAVHTLKGSAGIFSLTPLVNLTHHLESLLMQVRDGQRTLNEDLTSLMLRCMDELRTMLEAVEPDTGELHVDLAEQARLLEALAQARGLSEDTSPIEAAPATPVITADEQLWNLSIDFSEDLLRNGFDPVA